MQAFFDGLLVLAVTWFIARRPRTPGVIGAWMLITYALGRIPMDLFRLPDAGVTQFGFLTRGQLYSAIMLIAGVAVLVITKRKGAPKMGGWATPQPPPEPSPASSRDS